MLTKGCTEDLIWQAVGLEFEGDEDKLLDISVAHAVYLWEEYHLQLLCGEQRQTFGTIDKEYKRLPCGIMLSDLLKALIHFTYLVFNCPHHSCSVN